MGRMYFTARNPEDARTERLDAESMAAKPFVKWAGGKSQILDEIRRRYPAGLGTIITKYAEPFVGGGAVLFDILNNYQIRQVFISDINKELIQTYINIRDYVKELVGELKTLETQYLQADNEARKRMYYALRDQYNVLKLIGEKSIQTSALFLFLNRTCFNGLYRVNAHGAFNVPQGRYQKPMICDEQNLLAVSKKLKNVEIVCADYRQAGRFIDKYTFAYFDPPYRPLTLTSNFTSYEKKRFGDKEQVELAAFIDEMSTRGATILASNSDPKNTNANDDFFDSLYQRHTITRICASRSINSVGSSRGKINELIISN